VRFPFRITQGDRLPDLVLTLKNGLGAPIDFTQFAYSRVEFMMRPQTGADRRPVINAGVMDVLDAVGGRVRYQWAEASTDTPGNFVGLVTIIMQDGRRWTFPNRDEVDPFIPILILPKL